MTLQPPATATPQVAPLIRGYRAARAATEQLCTPLEPDDYLLQSMPDASPVKWHLAHTTWFFETFLLAPHLPAYRPYCAEFSFLFNSYYEAVGARWPRPARSLLARPTIAEVYHYRAHVDEAVTRLLAHDRAPAAIAGLATLGIQHEQQHQELIVTDLKHAWAANPLRPTYAAPVLERGEPPPARLLPFPERLAWIGHEGPAFAFDNELPRHRAFVAGFELARHPVTNGQFVAFIDDGGYDRPELWLSDGWAARHAQGWAAPLYWERHEGDWQIVTLAGTRPLAAAEPVCHVSYYEADAFARWAGARLPTEAEWETAAASVPLAGHFQESGRFHPAVRPAEDDRGPLYQLFGDVWQWTASPYVGYPGYQAVAGALGEYNGKMLSSDSPKPGFDINAALAEYNGKFMSGQQIVLRGASCATPRSHARLTYRNFFPPHARWQFSGIRLAKDLT